MNKQIRPLIEIDLREASKLDRKWFGEYGISEEELAKYLSDHPTDSIALIQDDELQGFATFEVLENSIPKDYVGDISPAGKVLFIQQFTTATNYRETDWRMDEHLLQAVEKKAQELACVEVWEALAIDHPYKKENKPGFDAFGFYESHGYIVDETHPLAWEPSANISIPCFLFRKQLLY